MADQHGQFTRESAERIADATRYVERLQRNDTPGRGRVGTGLDIRLAMTTAEHAAGVEQAVNLCSPAWVESAEQVTAMNDALIAIPDDTKLYVARFAGKWRVLQAFICEPE